MKNILKKLIANNGVMAIEFSFVYIVFVAFVFVIFEMCKFFFVVVAMDFSLSEAAKVSAYTEKTTQRDFTKVFNEHFFKQNNFWVIFINPEDITITASFCENINDVIRSRCSSVYSYNKKIALYSVNYRYKPLKAISGIPWSETIFSGLDGLLTRKVVHMIESSR